MSRTNHLDSAATVVIIAILSGSFLCAQEAPAALAAPVLDRAFSLISGDLKKLAGPTAATPGVGQK